MGRQVPLGNGGTLAGGAGALWGPERRIAERLGVFAPCRDSQPGPPWELDYRVLKHSARTNVCCSSARVHLLTSVPLRVCVCVGARRILMCFV